MRKILVCLALLMAPTLALAQTGGGGGAGSFSCSNLQAGSNVTITGSTPPCTISSSGSGGGGNPGPYTVGTAITSTGAISASNSTYCVNPGAPITLTLPASPSTGARIVLKDCGGAIGAGTTVTITPASGNVDGQTFFVMNTPYQSNAFWYSGSQWSVE